MPGRDAYLDGLLAACTMPKGRSRNTRDWCDPLLAWRHQDFGSSRIRKDVVRMLPNTFGSIGSVTLTAEGSAARDNANGWDVFCIVARARLTAAAAHTRTQEPRRARFTGIQQQSSGWRRG
jgi:hypothetical protein